MSDDSLLFVSDPLLDLQDLNYSLYLLNRYFEKGFEDHRLELLQTAFYSRAYHANALLHPFTHTLRGMRNLVRALEELVMIIPALLYNRGEAGDLALGALQEVAAAFVNGLNVLMSLVSFLTRTVATILNLGYTKSTESDQAFLINQERLAQVDENSSCLSLGLACISLSGRFSNSFRETDERQLDDEMRNLSSP